MITRSGRQPRRDRPPGVRHLPPARHRHRRRLHRPGRRLPARGRGRRPGPPGGPQRVPGCRAADRRGPRRGRRRHPPRLRIPLGERRIRRRRAGRRPDVDRAAGRRGRRDGLQDRGQEDDGRRGRAGARRTRSRHRDRGPAAGADQGVGGRRRPRHAGRARIVRAAQHKWRPRAARRSRRSAIRRCSASATWPPATTSRSRCSPTRTARCGRSANASAPSSGATRRSSKRRRRRWSNARRACGTSCSTRHGWRRPRSATPVRAPSSSWPTSSGDFFFLEMNTRLQVEHPVTEETTGLDLVELQLQVADGGHLDPDPPPSRGYSIEARLYAEDPGKGWQPQAGTVHHFEVPVPNRPPVDTGIVDGSVVSVFYDPMIAKVISYASNRRQAAGVLADALARTRIHGVRTNRDLLVNVLRHPRLPRRRHRHRVLRHPRPGRAGRTAGRPTRSRTLGTGRRPCRCGAEPTDRNGVHHGTQRMAQPRLRLPDQVLQRRVR